MVRGGGWLGQRIPVSAARARSRPATIAPTHFRWNYTTFLNFAFMALAGYLYWLHRNRDRLGGGTGVATDPVCGMLVQTANAPAHITHDHHEHWFCSDRCAERFAANPATYLH